MQTAFLKRKGNLRHWEAFEVIGNAEAMQCGVWIRTAEDIIKGAHNA